MRKYIHQYRGYPNFAWDSAIVLDALARAASRQGALLGRMRQFGFDLRREAAFWQKHAMAIADPIINRLMDGFTGNMASGKAAKILKVSQDTAARLLKNLAEQGFLELKGAGRNTHYALPDV